MSGKRIRGRAENKNWRQTASDDSTTTGSALAEGILGAGALAFGLAGYSFYRILQDQDEDDIQSEVHTTRSNFGKEEGPSPSSTKRGTLMVPTIKVTHSSSEDQIVLATDVNEEKARIGGLLLLPKFKTVYFYSFGLPPQLPFAEHKLPLLSVVFALELFQDSVIHYKKTFPDDQTVVKTGQCFRDERHFAQLLETINSQRETFQHKNVEWERSTKDEDVHIRIAGSLSINNAADWKDLAVEDGEACFDGFAQINLSDRSAATFDKIKRYFPEEGLTSSIAI